MINWKEKIIFYCQGKVKIINPFPTMIIVFKKKSRSSLKTFQRDRKEGISS